jgi:NADPH:quinone reductase-like Zn-dependent oxidoreductase
LAGLKVVCVLDVERNGERILRHGADLLVDRHDEARAVKILRGITKGKLRFGLDTRGKESIGLLAEAMRISGDDPRLAHVVGLTGIPKVPREGVKYHSVPIKSFHEVPAVGDSLMIWLEQMLAEGLLSTPDIEVAGGGLDGINAALDRLRDGSVSGPRLVVPI